MHSTKINAYINVSSAAEDVDVDLAIFLVLEGR
jgi:hypothetical protein